MNPEYKFRICVVIVNYHSAKMAIDCIRSLKDQLDIHQDIIALVDNNSGQLEISNIKDILKTEDPDGIVKLIENETNSGFSAGNNVGIRSFRSKFYLLTNADTILGEKAVSKLVAELKQHPDVGIVGPRLESADGQPQVSCFRFPSPASELINSADTGVITRTLKSFDIPIETNNEPFSPEWISFACVLIRETVFSKIGYLDEGFFMYYEDVDFCRRTRIAGINIRYFPDARVIHLQGQSSGVQEKMDRNERLPFYYYKSRSRYFVKYYGWIGFVSGNMLWYFGRVVSLLREILMRKKCSVPKRQFFDIWIRFT